MRRQLQNFYWTLGANVAALSAFFAWACTVSRDPKIPELTQADRDCAAELAVFATLTKAGSRCDEALAFARLAGPACRVDVKCIDAAPVSVSSALDLDGGAE